MRDNHYLRPRRPAARVRAAAAPRADSENHKVMMSGLLLLASAALLLLAGCQNVSGFGYTNEEVHEASLEATAFNRNLYEDYMELSDAERAEFDWNDAHFFAAKALTAARDEKVGPETIYERSVPLSKVEELRGARNRLITALDRGAPVKVPVDAARAQASFDCWLQEQEENFQLNDISACRESFHQAMARVEAALGERYLVYFDFDSDRLTGEAKQVLKEVVEAAKAKADTSVLIGGHADSAGSEDYNLALSEARAQAIKSLLLSAGVKSSQIGTAEHGETEPAVYAPDNTPEARNRRVEISVTK